MVHRVFAPTCWGCDEFRGRSWRAKDVSVCAEREGESPVGPVLDNGHGCCDGFADDGHLNMFCGGEFHVVGAFHKEFRCWVTE